MDLLALAKSPIAAFIASFSPSLKGVLDFAKSHETLLEAGIPVIKAAIKEGPAALEAVKEKTPELIEALKHLIANKAEGSAPARAALTHDAPMENVLRSLAGAPRMTVQEESAFLNRMTPGNDPSQENSKFTVG